MDLLRTSSLVAVSLAACLYDGASTLGLPCNVDDDCSSLQCVYGVCGGPNAPPGTSTGETGESSSGEPINEQELPEPCTNGHTTCLGSRAMEICEDGRLHQFYCEWWCGQEDSVEGGCQVDPRDGHEQCWCASSGGPPSGTCEVPCSSHSDCASGEKCLNTASGWRCLPPTCSTCFEDGQWCYWYEGSCKFGYCQ